MDKINFKSVRISKNTIQGKLLRLILPVIGVAVLIALLVLIIKIVKIVNGLKTTVSEANKAIGTVGGYLTELNTTVKTVNNVSMSVESVRFTASKLISKAIDSWNKEYESIKTLLTALLEKLLKLPVNKAQEPAEETEEKNENDDEVIVVNPK